MPALSRRQVVLKEIRQEAVDVKSFRLVPKDGLPISFIPGQWVTLGIFTEDGTSFSESRPYSIASSPTDPESIWLTFDIVGSFTTKLNGLEVGATLGIMGPFGHFTFKEDEVKHAVFIAGGIGVTPLMGMARYAAAIGSPTPITFLYSNKTLEHTVFHDELKALSKTNPKMKTIFTLTRAEDLPASWDGESGRINPEMVLRHVPNPRECTYFICGPLKMVQDLSSSLKETFGLESEQVKVEGWG